jgi:hypothetical protein
VLAEQLQQTKQLASTWQQEVEKLQWQLQQDTSTLLKQVEGLQLEAEHSRTELQQLQAMLTGQSAGEQLQTLQHELLLSMQREKVWSLQQCLLGRRHMQCGMFVLSGTGRGST